MKTNNNNKPNDGGDNNTTNTEARNGKTPSVSKSTLQQAYIKTPYSYTKLYRNLSLLQQTVLTKVSEHIQEHIQSFFGSDRCSSHVKPKGLFSDLSKSHGLPDFYISYAELGVSLPNYNVARAAVREVMELTIAAPGKDSNGDVSIIHQVIFTRANMSLNDKNGVAFTLNPEVVDWVFDMSTGYITHPINLTRIAKVERMPMMYFFLQRKSEKWKYKELHIGVTDIKEYLGLSLMVDAGNAERAGRKLKSGMQKVAYPKFSQFRKHVLDTNINDINRLREAGMLDVCVDYEPVYQGSRKVGNPEYIRFVIFDTIEELNAWRNNMAEGKDGNMPADAVAPSSERSPFSDPSSDTAYIPIGYDKWTAFLDEYKGAYAHLFPGFTYMGIVNNTVILQGTGALKETLYTFINRGTQSDRDELNNLFKKHFGNNIRVHCNAVL